MNNTREHCDQKLPEWKQEIKESDLLQLIEAYICPGSARSYLERFAFLVDINFSIFSGL